MEDIIYEVPICDLKSPKRNKIFHVKVNKHGEILEYMAQNVKDYRSVTEQEVRKQIDDFLKTK